MFYIKIKSSKQSILPRIHVGVQKWTITCKYLVICRQRLPWRSRNFSIKIIIQSLNCTSLYCRLLDDIAQELCCRWLHSWFKRVFAVDVYRLIVFMIQNLICYFRLRVNRIQIFNVYWQVYRVLIIHSLYIYSLLSLTGWSSSWFVNFKTRWFHLHVDFMV